LAGGGAMIYPGGWGGYWRRHHELLARFGMKIIAEPTGEQIDLATTYTHLSLTPDGSPLSHPDDAWLSDIAIPAAREYCETETERALATQTVEMGLNGFPGTYGWTYPLAWYGSLPSYFHYGIPLPMSPVQQIVSVTYVDGNSIVQTIDPTTYALDDWSPMNVLNLAPGTTAWPIAQQVPMAIKIRYIAGYSLPGDSPDVWPLPKLVRAAMLIMVGHFYENRESTTDIKMDEIPLGVSVLLRRYKLGMSLA
jgi:hypothetical protein